MYWKLIEKFSKFVNAFNSLGEQELKDYLFLRKELF